MNIPVRHVRWTTCCRLIPTRYSEDDILKKVADPEDMKSVAELEQMTDERLRQERGDVSFIRPDDFVAGPGSEYVAAAFAYRNPEGSRFSDGAFGVYYAAHALSTAVEEAKHHRQVFMSRTKESPMQLEMVVLAADLDGHLHDIRGMRKKIPQIYSPTNYAASQELAFKLFKDLSFGIVYESVRHKRGHCVAVFRPPVLNRCRQQGLIIFEWDGKVIKKTYELHEYTD